MCLIGQIWSCLIVSLHRGNGKRAKCAWLGSLTWAQRHWWDLSEKICEGKTCCCPMSNVRRPGPHRSSVTMSEIPASAGSGPKLARGGSWDSKGLLAGARVGDEILDMLVPCDSGACKILRAFADAADKCRLIRMACTIFESCKSLEYEFVAYRDYETFRAAFTKYQPVPLSEYSRLKGVERKWRDC